MGFPSIVSFFVGMAVSVVYHVCYSSYKTCPTIATDSLNQYLYGCIIGYIFLPIIYGNSLFHVVPGLRTHLGTLILYFMFCFGGIGFQIFGIIKVMSTQCIGITYYSLAVANLIMLSIIIIAVLMLMAIGCFCNRCLANVNVAPTKKEE